MARGDGSVVVRILGEVDDLKRKLREGGDSVKKFGTDAKSALKGSVDDAITGLTSRFGRLGDVAGTALSGMADDALAAGSAISTGVAAGAAAAVVGIGALAVKGVQSFADLAAKVRDLQRVTGATAEESSALVAVMDDFEIDANAGAAAIFRFSKNLTANADALRDHGIVIARNNDGTTDLIGTLLNVAKAYDRVGGGAAGNKIAFDAFGRSGAALIPLLTQGREALEQFLSEADKHGEILSQEDLEAAEDYRLALDDLSDAVGGLQRATGEGLVPALTDAAEGLADFVDGVNKATKPIGGLGAFIRGLFAAPGTDQLRHEFRRASDDAADSSKKSEDAARRQADALEETGDKAETAAPKLDLYKDAVDGITDSAFAVEDAQQAASRALASLVEEAEASEERQAEAARRGAEAIENAQRRRADAVESANRRIRDAERDLADAQEEVVYANKADARRDAQKRVEQAQRRLDDARTDGAREVADADRDVADASRDAAEQLERWVPALDKSSKLGIANRDRMQEFVEKTAAAAVKMKEQGDSASKISGYIARQIGDLGEVGDQLGFNRDTLAEYVRLLETVGAVTALMSATSFTTPSGKQAVATTGATGGIDRSYAGKSFSFGDINIFEAKSGTQVAQDFLWNIGRVAG